MKKIIGMLWVFWHSVAMAQQPVSTQPISPLFKAGYQYQTGIGKVQNSARAVQLFRQASMSGDAHSMNAMGNIYSTGALGYTNTDSALYWYKQAGKNGYGTAYYNLGEIYRQGSGLTQDFVIAGTYYEKGRALGNDDCSNVLAYFYFKGFGIQQDYNKAFQLYLQLASKGIANAMYFVGLCYRNGYGTLPDANLAKQWLLKAATLNDWQAIHELTAEPAPENRNVLTSDMQTQVASLKSYQEKMITDPSTDISGTYAGHAIYYDFSGNYVHEIVPLTITLTKSDIGYQGIWTEGDSLTAPIKGTFSDNTFLFDSSCRYVRHNYYSYESPEPYQFNKAALNIKYLNDSVYLSGNIQFYSLKRKEPGQPMFISLSHKTDGVIDNINSKVMLNLFPNPVHDIVNARFVLDRATRVSLEIITQDGKPLQEHPFETLPAGTYDSPFDMKSLAAGSYFLILHAGNRTEHKLFVKL